MVNCLDQTSCSFLFPNLLILDDLGLHPLTFQQLADLYELIIRRHRVSSLIITGNCAVEEWLSLLDDPILETGLSTTYRTPASRSSSGGQLQGRTVSPPQVPGLRWS